MLYNWQGTELSYVRVATNKGTPLWLASTWNYRTAWNSSQMYIRVSFLPRHNTRVFFCGSYKAIATFARVYTALSACYSSPSLFYFLHREGNADQEVCSKQNFFCICVSNVVWHCAYDYGRIVSCLHAGLPRQGTTQGSEIYRSALWWRQMQLDGKCRRIRGTNIFFTRHLRSPWYFAWLMTPHRHTASHVLTHPNPAAIVEAYTQHIGLKNTSNTVLSVECHVNSVVMKQPSIWWM